MYLRWSPWSYDAQILGPFRKLPIPPPPSLLSKPVPIQSDAPSRIHPPGLKCESFACRKQEEVGELQSRAAGYIVCDSAEVAPRSSGLWSHLHFRENPYYHSIFKARGWSGFPGFCRVGTFFFVSRPRVCRRLRQSSMHEDALFRLSRAFMAEGPPESLDLEK